MSGDHVFGLQALVTHHDGVFDTLAFDQYPVAFATNRAEMDEDIIAAVARDEAKAFRCVEPFDRSGLAACGWGYGTRISGAWCGGGAAVTLIARLGGSQVQQYGNEGQQQARQCGGLSGDG